MLGTLRRLITTIEVIEKSFMRVAIGGDGCRLSTSRNEVLGMLDSLHDLGVIVRSRGDASSSGVGIALGFDAADHPHPGLAAVVSGRRRAGGELVGWGCGGDGRGRCEGDGEDGELHGGLILRLLV